MVSKTTTPAQDLADAIIGVLTDADPNEWEYAKIVMMIQDEMARSRLEGIRDARQI
jgi:hypothetical protein